MFEQCLFFNTTSLARQLERIWALAFKPFGLTPSQAFLLRVILEKGAITATDLSSILNISRATCSRSLDGLIALDLVERVQAGTDGRSHELHPTQKARKMRDEINQASGAVTRKIKLIVGNETFTETVKSLRDISSSIR